jgi:maleate isomerase
MHGWRAHLGKIAPEPIQAWIVREFYEVMPEGVDVTIALLEIEKKAKRSLLEVAEVVGHPAKLLSERGADVVYLDAIAPIVSRDEGYDRGVIHAMETATGRPCATAVNAGVEAFRALGVQRIALCSTFDEMTNAQFKSQMTNSGVDVVCATSHGVEIHAAEGRLPEEFQYVSALKAMRTRQPAYDALYLPFGEFEKIENIARLEQDIGKPVVTSHALMMWWFLKTAGVKAPLAGYGKLLSTIG